MPKFNLNNDVLTIICKIGGMKKWDVEEYWVKSAEKVRMEKGVLLDIAGSEFPSLGWSVLTSIWKRAVSLMRIGSMSTRTSVSSQRRIFQRGRSPCGRHWRLVKNRLVF